jgi:hypothetical protein
MRTKKKLLHAAFLLIVAISLTSKAEATIWRVNNIVGIGADFKTLNAAFLSNNVLAGDTVYVEPSAQDYDIAYLKKKLVIIGPGYNLGAEGNPGLQYTDKVSEIYIILTDSLASGCTFLGLSGRISVHPSVDDLTISRCNFAWSDYSSKVGAVCANISITKSIVNFYSGNSFNNLYFANNIVNSYAVFSKALNSIVRNNIFTISLDIQASYISNNIFVTNNALKLINCTVKNNIATTGILPAGDNNQNNKLATDLFAGGTNIDAKYKLKAGSPAIGAGETINGITPDAGIFGTADPYRLSGIPAIPSIYQFTVPENVPSTATQMTVTFSTRSNN